VELLHHRRGVGIFPRARARRLDIEAITANYVIKNPLRSLKAANDTINNFATWVASRILLLFRWLRKLRRQTILCTPWLLKQMGDLDADSRSAP
jgi:hypothetical protein